MNGLKKKPIADDRLNRIIKYLAIALLALAVVFMAVQFSEVWSWIINAIRTVIVPVALAWLFALIMFPLIRYLEKKGIGPRGLSLGIVFLLTVGIIFAIFFFVTPFVVDEIKNFFTDDYPVIVVHAARAPLRRLPARLQGGRLFFSWCFRLTILRGKCRLVWPCPDV